MCPTRLPTGGSSRTTPLTELASTGCSPSSTSTPWSRPFSSPRRDEGSEVTALCLGPEKAVDAVRKSLQMGVDKGVHVLDDAIAGSDAPATSLVLAEAIKKTGTPDLIICGMASTDGSMSVVPAMLAERLGLPQVTFASVVETQGDQVRIKRDGDTATEVIGATLPIVLSVTDQTGEARYPSFKGIMAAKKKPMETLSLSDLGLSADQVGLSAAWSVVEETTARPPRTAGEIVTDEGGSGAKALADFLVPRNSSERVHEGLGHV